MPLAYGSALQLKTAVQSFWNSYYAITDPFDGCVFTRASTQKTDTYARLGAAPMPQEWVGNKEAKDVNEYTFTITNKSYESTVKVGKDLIKYQQWDEIGRLLGNLGEKARLHQVSLMTTLIEAGAATVCEDGQFFYDTDHANAGAEYTTSQVNTLTTVAATGTIPTDIEFASAVRATLQQFYTFKDDRGDPAVPQGSLDASNLVCMTAPGFMGVAERVANAETLTGPVANDMQGRFQVRVNPFMTATGTTPAVYFFYIGSDHKAIIRQQVQDVELSDSMTGDEHFRSGDVSYSADWWGRVQYGEWRSTILQTFT